MSAHRFTHPDGDAGWHASIRIAEEHGGPPTLQAADAYADAAVGPRRHGLGAVHGQRGIDLGVMPGRIAPEQPPSIVIEPALLRHDDVRRLDSQEHFDHSAWTVGASMQGQQVVHTNGHHTVASRKAGRGARVASGYSQLRQT